MSRKRKITPDDILDAVERVVIRVGVAGLSIDAVSKEAGVSKSRVVYDHKSKSALLDALIKRHLDFENQRVNEAVQKNLESPHPELYGRIAVAEPLLSEADRAVAMAIGAAMSGEKILQERLKAWSFSGIDTIKQTDKPQAAMLAYLVLSGFYWHEMSGFNHWTSEERQQILENIRLMFMSFPEPEPVRAASDK